MRPHRAPGSTPYRDDYDDDLTPVVMACLCCRGHGSVHRDDGVRYSRARCPWCSDGVMSGSQVNEFLKHDQRSRRIEHMVRRYLRE